MVVGSPAHLPAEREVARGVAQAAPDLGRRADRAAADTAGLTLEGWRYFAIFVAVIVGLITESLPGAATGLIGITITAMLGLVEPRPLDSIRWALTGFVDSTVWLMFVAFMLAIWRCRSGSSAGRG